MAEGTGGVDLATLGLRVDGREVDRATQSLKQFTAEGERAEQTARKLGASVEGEARQVRRVQDIYVQAARERRETERAVSRMAVGETAVDAKAAAEAYVRAQEMHYHQNMARVRLAAAQGLITPQEAAQQGQQAAQAYNSAIAGVIERRPQFRDDRGAFTALAGSLKDVETAGRRGSLGMHRLNNSLVVMARTATGAHPVVGQLTDVVGTFAIGTAAMVPILAGIAAIGFAWQGLTKDAREAKKEHERLLDILRDIEKQRRIEALGPGGEAVTAVGATRDRISELEDEIRRQEQLIERGVGGLVGEVGPQLRIEQMREEIEDLRKLQTEGEEEIADETAAIRARSRRDRLRTQNAVEAAARAHQDELLEIEREAEEERAEARRDALQLRLRVEEVVTERLEQEERERAEARREALALRLEVAEVVAKREEELREERERAEAELQKAREKALNNLVQALNNVGRAYGGVTDQVLSLVSAVLSLESMPMGTQRDRFTAFGTAAATGVGVGATTANPILGAAGGAASGFALAGPVGAVLGGVGGLVSGLFGQAKKAEEAARIEKEAARQRAQALADWQRAVEAFGGATDRLGEQEFQQRIKEWRELNEVTNAGFGPGVGATAEEWAQFIERIQADVGNMEVPGFTEDLFRLAEQWREFVAETVRQFEQDLQVRLLRAQGLDAEADALRLAIQHEREYTEAVAMGLDAETLTLLEKVQAEEKLAQARRDELDAINAVTQALNAPQGLNLALMAYRASLEGEAVRRQREGGIRPDGGFVDPDRRRGTNIETLNVNVYESTNPRETARVVIEEINREARLGGTSPTEVTRR